MVPAVREAGIKLITTAAASLARAGRLEPPPAPSAFSELVLELMDSIPRIIRHRDLMEGYVHNQTALSFCSFHVC